MGQLFSYKMLSTTSPPVGSVLKKQGNGAMEISSAQNPRYKTWQRLLDARGIKKHGQMLIAGRKIINEVLDQFPQRVEGVILRNEPRNQEDVANLALPPDCPVYLLPHDLFAALDIYGIKEPILLAQAPTLPEWIGSLSTGLTVFLPFQSPINLGTTIRSAAAFGAAVVLLREAASPYLPKCLRASGPAVFQVSLFQGPSLEELAKHTHLSIFALSPKGENIFSFPFSRFKEIGLVAGMEGPGLDVYWTKEKRLSIPMTSQVESLNASVAMGIAMACQISLS